MYNPRTMTNWSLFHLSVAAIVIAPNVAHSKGPFFWRVLDLRPHKAAVERDRINVAYETEDHDWKCVVSAPEGTWSSSGLLGQGQDTYQEDVAIRCLLKGNESIGVVSQGGCFRIGSEPIDISGAKMVLMTTEGPHVLKAECAGFSLPKEYK